MADKRFAILKGDYVVNVILWDKDKNPNFRPPGNPDKIVEDPSGSVGRGDKYDAENGVFYRVINDVEPPDAPAELRGHWDRPTGPPDTPPGQG
jgi:hypothetical protein